MATTAHSSASGSGTSLSASTRRITRALGEIGDRYSFLYHVQEFRLYVEEGNRSERVDVVFCLRSDNRPVFHFEIDNDPTREAHNLLKLFEHPHRVIPATALAVLHGRAAHGSLSYPEVMLSNAALPRHFLAKISIETSTYSTVVTQLSTWIEGIFENLRSAPEWGSVLEISSSYQALVTSGGFHLAVAHLETQAELAWVLAHERYLDVERAACLTISLARMLQRAGYHREARRQMRLLRRRVPRFSGLSRNTASSARAIAFMLGPGPRSKVFSPEHLELAFNNVDEAYHQSQFIWRSAIPLIIQGDSGGTENIIARYRGLAEFGTTQSNIALLRTLNALKWKLPDRREFANEYATHELDMLGPGGTAPDGTVHGVVAALYLRLAAELSTGNRRAVLLLSEVDRFCLQAGIPPTADGLREIKAVLSGSFARLPSENRRGEIMLWSEVNKTLKLNLHELYARVNRACLG